MAPAYDGLESVPPDLWIASQAPSNAEASILIASGSKEEFVPIGMIDMFDVAAAWPVGAGACAKATPAPIALIALTSAQLTDRIVSLRSSGGERRQLGLQSVDTRLQHLGNAGNCKHLVAQLVDSRHQRIDHGGN